MSIFTNCVIYVGTINKQKSRPLKLYPGFDIVTVLMTFVFLSTIDMSEVRNERNFCPNRVSADFVSSIKYPISFIPIEYSVYIVQVGRYTRNVVPN